MIRIAVTDSSQVAQARRQAIVMAESIGFDETAAARAALITTELATNLIKHAGGGEILFRTDEDCGAAAVLILALDKGPGMASVQHCLEDGYSTAGSTGTGLGAVVRQAHDFEVASQLGEGTAIYVRCEAGRLPTARANSDRSLGVICLPKPGEPANGDAWSMCGHPSLRTFLVADGLGHGIAAAEASAAAVHSFRASATRTVSEILAAIHEALRPTRGAAVAVARIDTEHNKVSFGGIGNITGTIVSGLDVRKTISRNGTAGHQLLRIHEYDYPFATGSVLVMCSDGLGSSWNPSRYPGFVNRHPALIAGLLYRDYRRERDDVTVLVCTGSAT